MGLVNSLVTDRLQVDGLIIGKSRLELPGVAGKGRMHSPYSSMLGCALMEFEIDTAFGTL